MSGKWTKHGIRNAVFLGLAVVLLGVNIWMGIKVWKFVKRVDKVEEANARQDDNDVNLMNALNTVVFDRKSMVEYYEGEGMGSKEELDLFIKEKRDEELARRQEEEDKKRLEGMTDEELDKEIERLKSMKEENKKEVKE